jgi:DNA (cytosine-5)-methyltransferase 1
MEHGYLFRMVAPVKIFTKASQRRSGSSRLWVASSRLPALGFTPGQCFSAEKIGPHGISLRPAKHSKNRVSFQRRAGGPRPVIDLALPLLSSIIAPDEEMRLTLRHNQVLIEPSVRTFGIRRSRAPRAFYSYVEMFAGGGTLSKALEASGRFRCQSAIELNPDFADVFSAVHPHAEVLVGDARTIHPGEIEPFDVLIAGIPCTSFAPIGIAHHKIEGREEDGPTGDLFIPVLSMVNHHLPRMVVVENVPGFKESAPGRLFKAHLQRLGYHVFETVLKGHEDWNEPTTRDRYLLVASLTPGFDLVNPHRPFAGTLADYLDPLDEARDREDIARIAKSVAYYQRNAVEQKAKGNNFHFQTLSHASTWCPTLTKSMCFIKPPFVETPWGFRRIRREEAERLQGMTVPTTSDKLAWEIIGQGVLPKVFKQVAGQVAAFLDQASGVE